MQRLTEKKKQLIRDFVNNKCEGCHKKFDKLIPHRIKRGRDGGKYELRNLKMLCDKCHKAYHRGEFK